MILFDDLEELLEELAAEDAAGIRGELLGPDPTVERLTVAEAKRRALREV